MITLGLTTFCARVAAFTARENICPATTAAGGFSFHNKPVKRACEYESADEKQGNHQFTYDIRG